VFFFDEAHVLFKTAPESLIEKIEQIVRLIRSKGVGVFFVTQHPEDVPDAVGAQLATRIQHALRAFTPKEQDSLKSAGRTFRQNPAFDATEVLPNLRVGEALVSTLDASGTPTVVEQTLIRPPASRIGPLTAEERAEKITSSPLAATYSEFIDRESAYELLKKRAEQAEETEKPAARKSTRQGPIEAFIKSVLRSVGSSLGRQIARGVLGSVKIK
jgi:DNA helicase HerA-like ATPase